MPPINVNLEQNYNQMQQNISTNARQGQISTQPQIQQPSQIAARLAGIRTGMLVEGSVVSQNSDGTYLVRVDVNGVSQELRARATISLIPGERFKAVWDASGSDGVPVLRLSQGELSFLSQIPSRDRELATALLARGLPLSNEVLNAIKDAWRKSGSTGDLSSFIELWARDVPMTSENAMLLSQYAAMNGAEATEMWEKIRKELKSKTSKGSDPVAALREMKEGSDDIAKFLQAQSILMKSPRNEVNPLLLAAPFWPVLNDSSQNMTAKIFVGKSAEDDGQKYWQVGFGITGSVLGEVGGLVESDGKSCNLTLNAEKVETCKLIERRRRDLRRELQGLEIPVTFIGISRRAVENERDILLAGRGLDITV
ncbi:MAG: hypothetical protein IJP96_00695 [Synergistaceae bacterium]|nr:hypothetical protein [Synergistaceae bacterium]MBR0074256.1 hypothetical protein [Synergistaceae bacterium]MBR0232535.1 hypothetical protein [Synergistaceae bacterium]MBR0253716.1 hypothetical protein [Synergistaceae bacterium]